MSTPEYHGWRKSSYSDAGDNCVDVAVSDDGTSVGVRDTKDRQSGILEFSAQAWKHFVDGIRRGEFDR